MKIKLKPQNLLIVLACICLIIGTFVVLLSNHSTSNSDSKTKTVNKHYETIATVMMGEQLQKIVLPKKI